MLMTSRPVLAMRSALRSLGVTRAVARILHRSDTHAVIEAYRRNPTPFVKVELHGLTIQVKADNEHEVERTIISRADQRIVPPLLDRLQNNAVLWDIGANVGLYTCLAARQPGCATVVAFDPDPWCVQRLRDNVEANQLKNVQLHTIALSDRRDKMKFEMAPLSIVGSSHLIDDPSAAVASDRLVEVETWPGDQYIAANAAPAPNAIKIDVEGFEGEVIRGLRQTLATPNCRTVLIELHFSVLASRKLSHVPDEIVKTLREAGFDKITFPDASHLFAVKSA